VDTIAAIFNVGQDQAVSHDAERIAVEARARPGI
jgi:hypothetical protein